MEFVNTQKALGNECYKQGNFLNALSHYSEAIKHPRLPNDSLTTLLSNRAACYLKLERYDECVGDCSLALSISPDLIKARFRRASAYYFLNLLQESFKDLKVILNFDNQNKEANDLMKELQIKMSKEKASNHEIKKLLEIIQNDPLRASASFLRLIELCRDSRFFSLEFAQNDGNKLLLQVINDIESLEDKNSIFLLQSIFNLISALIKHNEYFFKYVDNKYITSQELGNMDTPLDYRINFVSLFELFEKFKNLSIHKSLSMLIFQYIDQISRLQLEIDQEFIRVFFLTLIETLSSEFNDLIELSCDNISLLISNSRYFLIKDGVDIDVSTETIEERKKRILEQDFVSLRSKLYSRMAVECGILTKLIPLLDSNSFSTKQIVGSTICKIIHFFSNDDEIKSIIEGFFANFINASGLEKYKILRIRASLETNLMLAKPELGSWCLLQNDCIYQLQELLESSDLKNIEIASETLCLSANDETLFSKITNIIPQEILASLLLSETPSVKIAAASAIAKIAVKSKSLSSQSPENSLILNAISEVLKGTDFDKTQKNSMATFERSIEALATLASKTYIKEEIVHGSNRVTSLIKELVKLEIDSRSTIALGLAHIFSQLTVTNHELMLQALSEKELTHQQYQQLKKLSKIKTKDEKGSIIEEKEEEEDLDNDKMCKLRIRKIVNVGGIILLIKLLSHTSDQVKLYSSRSLRQICAEENSRGLFIQQGGLKACIQLSTDLSAQKQIKLEAAHAIAKAMITTNPNMISDHLRLGSLRSLLYLCKKLREVTSNYLQQFEALLSITNILSCGDAEQNRFASDGGVNIVHYLIFSENLMVRRAAVEALCNMSSHDSLLKLLRDPEKVKLWLGLSEEFEGPVNEETKEQFLTAKAASGTLAVAAQDPDVSRALMQEDCFRTIIRLLSSNQMDLIHRSLFLVNQILDSLELEELIKYQFMDLNQFFNSIQFESAELQELTVEILGKIKKIMN